MMSEIKQSPSGHPLEFFDRVYVINLKSRPDRRRQMEGEFASVGFSSRNLEWFDAVKPDSRGPFETVGARGCFLSHLGVFAKASSHNLERFAILEDDCDFVGEFNLRMSAIVRQLQATQWDVFYGGGRVDARLPLTGELAKVEVGTPVGCAYFIAFQGTHVIGRIQGYLEAQLARPGGDPAGGPMHVDGSYSWARRDLLLQTLIANPDICHQRSSRSDITPAKWWDRTPGVRHAAGMVREFRRTITRKTQDRR